MNRKEGCVFPRLSTLSLTVRHYCECVNSLLAPRMLASAHKCTPHHVVSTRFHCQATRNESPLVHTLLSDKRFHCTECGKCCTGAGEVFVNEEESQRIAVHLNISLTSFQQRFTLPSRKHRGWRLIKTVGPQQDCVFLRDKLCTIYAARPVQCSTYPWWPELMAPSAWEAEAERCEGIGHDSAGPLSVEDAAAQLHKFVQHTTGQPAKDDVGPFDFLDGGR